MIAVDRAHLPRPARLHAQISLDLLPRCPVDLGAVVVDDHRLDAEERIGCGTRLEVGGAGQWTEQDPPRLGLPPGIDDRAAAFADNVVVPAPGLGVDRLTHRPEQAQRRPVGPGHKVIALTHQRPDRGRRGVEDVDAMLFDHLPEAADIREIGHALEHQRGRPVHQRAVDDVGVPGNPAHVGGAPEHLTRAVVEDKVMRRSGIDPVAACGVQHALRFAGRPGGVEDEQRVFGVHRLGFAGLGLFCNQLVVPGIARVPVHGPAGAPDHQRRDTAPGNLDCAIGVGLERDCLAPAQPLVSRNQEVTLAANDALSQRLG